MNSQTNKQPKEKHASKEEIAIACAQTPLIRIALAIASSGLSATQVLQKGSYVWNK